MSGSVFTSRTSVSPHAPRITPRWHQVTPTSFHTVNTAVLQCATDVTLCYHCSVQYCCIMQSNRLPLCYWVLHRIATYLFFEHLYTLMWHLYTPCDHLCNLHLWLLGDLSVSIGVLLYATLTINTHITNNIMFFIICSLFLVSS